MSFFRFRLKCLAVIAATLLLVAVDGNAAQVNEGSKYPLVSVETADELFGDDYDEETSQRYIGVTTPLAAGGNPWMDVSVIDTKHQRPTFPLEDNFYAASNHDWLVEVDSQGIKSRYDVFDDVNGDVNIKLARLLEDRSYISHDSSICQKVYDMVKNWNRRDKIGLAPLKAEVDAIEAIQTLEDMDKYLIGEEVPASGLIEPNMETDLNDSSRYVISINPMGLTLGDSAEYQKLTALGKRTKKANDTAAKKMLLLLRYDESSVKQKVDAMYRLEYALAGKIHTQEEMSKTDYVKRVNNPVTLAQLAEMAGRYPIVALLDKYGLSKAQRFTVPNIEYIRAVAEYYNEAHLQEMKDTLIAYRMLENLELLNSAANDIAMERNMTIRGFRGNAPDWFRGVEYVKHVLPGPLSNLYAEAYCSREMKKDIEGIIGDVCSYYKTMLRNEPFLSAAVKEEAIAKLDNITVRACMPDKAKSWKNIKLNKCKNLMEVNKALLKWEISEIVRKINEPVELEWTPSYTVNANYKMTDNSINIPAGILNGVFYQSDFSYEEKLGGIGMIIAHEITHGFDTNGAQFDERGNVNNWWTPEDKAEFEKKAARVVDYFNNITVYEGLHCNGEINKTEAIADMGGMKCMLSMAKKKPGFDYKKFFSHYASLWRCVYTRKYGEELVRTDVHPLPYLRVNFCVQQFDEFYDAYGIKPGAKMYLPKEERILVW
ncbi:MAG: M13 family metallopeptidase [Anaerovibrio sp.]|uniref:M13 family metallopeptidase n=1 Tax=uncultured Anaerovibrio sp. TaxID=361586 RepID=UPI001B6296E9|nr:M13 family metallopeptidase [uncultured Anaerovibrio sp.]MBP3231930.1 M13 family metallopeptidase [Anaerovibrio sp.]